MSWTRKLAKMGPADTYLDRYQVQHQSARKWQVVDLVTVKKIAGGFRSMAQAKDYVELYVNRIDR